MMPPQQDQIKADRVAYWYLRLNGFFAIPNFVVHPDPGAGCNQRTDIDVFAVRFPHRAELLVNPMQDDATIILSPTVPVILVSEVTTAKCKLNGPWTKPEKQNMQRVLRKRPADHVSHWSSVNGDSPRTRADPQAEGKAA